MRDHKVEQAREARWLSRELVAVKAATRSQIAVVATYVGLNTVGLVSQILRVQTIGWERGAAVAVLVPVVLFVALVMRRRWAWVTLLAFAVVWVILAGFSQGLDAIWGFDAALPLLLLISPPMRTYANYCPGER